MLKSADRAGIDKLCISSLGRTWPWVEFPSAQELEWAAEDVLAACARYPDRYIGFVYVSAQHLDTSLALMDRCIGNGPCQLVKLWISQYADDPRMDAIYAKALEYDVAVMAHTFIKATGNMQQESTYQHVVNVVERYPELNMWMAHCSGRWEEIGRVLRDYPRLAVDFSGGEPEAGIVETLLKDAQAEQVFFGSDAPGRDFSVQMSKVTSAPIDDATRHKILYSNIARWVRTA